MALNSPAAVGEESDFPTRVMWDVSVSNKTYYIMADFEDGEIYVTCFSDDEESDEESIYLSQNQIGQIKRAWRAVWSLENARLSNLTEKMILKEEV